VAWFLCLYGIVGALRAVVVASFCGFADISLTCLVYIYCLFGAFGAASFIFLVGVRFVVCFRCCCGTWWVQSWGGGGWGWGAVRVFDGGESSLPWAFGLTVSYLCGCVVSF